MSRRSLAGCILGLALAVHAAGAIAAANAAPALPPDAAAAVGGGLGQWWGEHGKAVTAVAGCVLDGAALARLFVVGAGGVGGVLAAAALGVAAIACMG